jgi:hypothetical protein
MALLRSDILAVISSHSLSERKSVKVTNVLAGAPETSW